MALNPIGSIERTHVVEEGGVPLISSLRKTDPFYNGLFRYGDMECIVKQGVDCGKSGCLNEITCLSCKLPVDPSEVPVRETNLPGGQQRYNYVGMTATSLHCRMLSHREGQRRKYQSNALYRHDLEVHSGVKQTYEARILIREQTLLPLSIIEGLYIEKQIIGTSLNGRNESGRGSIVRLQATRVI